MDFRLFPFLIALSIGIIVAVMIHTQHKKEKNGEVPEEGTSQYAALVSPYLLPFYIFLIVILWPITYAMYDSATDFILELFSIFSHISLYYAVILLLMPVIREKISARVCAVLWTLPTLAYMLLRFEEYYTIFSKPLLTIPLPRISFDWLCIVWACGFAAVMLWKCLSHLKFRKRILKSAEPVTDPMVLRLWEEEQVMAQVYQGYKISQFYIPLVQSEQVKTPLAIGLFKSTMYLVLPKRSYTEAEWRLIFRHELVHIGREDSGNKFFLTFCTAMCWFNPLVWIAMRQCAADLEFSCDETVLLHADPEEKKRYAHLLLQTAGDDRGFTTCLSASGASMRYRLKSIMKTTKRHVGGVLAGICMFVWLLSYGAVTMSFDSMTVGEAVFHKNNPYVLQYVALDQWDQSVIQGKQVAKPLRQYLEQQQVYRLTQEYMDGEERLILNYDDPDITIRLYDRMMEVRSYENRTTTKQYYFSEPLDWDYLYGLLDSSK